MTFCIAKRPLGGSANADVETAELKSARTNRAQALVAVVEMAMTFAFPEITSLFQNTVEGFAEVFYRKYSIETIVILRGGKRTRRVRVAHAAMALVSARPGAMSLK